MSREQRQPDPTKSKTPARSEDQERYGPVEAAPYHGSCGACGQNYYRGAKTRFHFLANGQALREHAQCGALAAPSYPARTARAQQIALELSA